MLLVKNDDSEFYVPDFGVDQVNNVMTGEGYKVLLRWSWFKSFTVEGMALRCFNMLTLDAYMI